MAVGVLVGMAVFVAVLMSAAAGALSVMGVLVRMFMGMFMGMAMFVAVFMSAAAGALPVMGVLVTMLMGMFLLMYVLVAAAVFCRIFRSVQMFVLFHNYALRMSFYNQSGSTYE